MLIPTYQPLAKRCNGAFPSAGYLGASAGGVPRRALAFARPGVRFAEFLLLQIFGATGWAVGIFAVLCLGRESAFKLFSEKAARSRQKRLVANTVFGCPPRRPGRRRATLAIAFFSRFLERARANALGAVREHLGLRGDRPAESSNWNSFAHYARLRR